MLVVEPSKEYDSEQETSPCWQFETEQYQQDVRELLKDAEGTSDEESGWERGSAGAGVLAGRRKRGVNLRLLACMSIEIMSVF